MEGVCAREGRDGGRGPEGLHADGTFRRRWRHGGDDGGKLRERRERRERCWK